MERRHLSPAALCPPFGRYHQMVEVRGAGRLLFVSGQLGMDAEGRLPEGAAAQAELALAAINACLEAAGMTRADVARLTVFLTDVADRAAYMRARDAWVADPPPASTLVVVKELVLPAARVEIEAVAAA